MATGFWRSSSSSSYSDNKSSLRIFAHSVAGYVSYYLPSNSALMQPTQGRALSYECLGPNAYRAIFQEIYFPVQGQPGIARTFCTVRAFDQTGSTMYYVDGESDGKCPEAELVLSQRHRKLLGGGNEGQRNSGILIRVPSSAITPPTTTCATSTAYTPSWTADLSKLPYPSYNDVPVESKCAPLPEYPGPNNVQGLWITSVGTSLVLETKPGWGSLSWNNDPTLISNNRGVYVGSQCLPTVNGTVIPAHVASFAQRRSIAGVVSSPPATSCKTKYRDVGPAPNVLKVDTTTHYLVVPLTGNPGLNCTVVRSDDGGWKDDDKHIEGDD